MSNKSKKQQHAKGPVRSRGSGNKPRTAENRRKRRARKRTERRQEQMVRGQKVLATLNMAPAGGLAEINDNVLAKEYFEDNDEVLDAERYEVWNPVSIEILEEELKIARERKQRALERRQVTHAEMMMCRDVMNEEFAGLQEEREAKDARRKDYEALRDRNNARINRIQDQINSLQHKSQDSYDRSKRAYHIAQTRDMAVPYSEQGHKYEVECNDLYEEMHRLGREVRERRLEVEADWVDDKFFVAARKEYLAAKEADDAAMEELELARVEVAELEQELMVRRA